MTYGPDFDAIGWRIPVPALRERLGGVRENKLGDVEWPLEIRAEARNHCTGMIQGASNAVCLTPS